MESTAHYRVRDSALNSKLKTEAPAILCRLAHYANRYLHGEKPNWELLEDEVRAYKNESFPLNAFLETCCVSMEALNNGGQEYGIDSELCEYFKQKEADWDTNRSALYAAYVEWDNKLQNMSRQAFYKIMEQKFRPLKYQGTRKFRGVRLLNPQEKLWMIKGTKG